MTNYSLRARMMILILAPTVLIGLLLSIFFVVHRYNDLQRQLEDAGASIIEPLAVSTEYGMSLQNRESIGQLISVLHRRHSDIVLHLFVISRQRHCHRVDTVFQHIQLTKHKSFHPAVELPATDAVDGIHHVANRTGYIAH